MLVRQTKENERRERNNARRESFDEEKDTLGVESVSKLYPCDEYAGTSVFVTVSALGQLRETRKAPRPRHHLLLLEYPHHPPHALPHRPTRAIVLPELKEHKEQRTDGHRPKEEVRPVPLRLRDGQAREDAHAREVAVQGEPGADGELHVGDGDEGGREHLGEGHADDAQIAGGREHGPGLGREVAREGEAAAAEKVRERGAGVAESERDALREDGGEGDTSAQGNVEDAAMHPLFGGGSQATIRRASATASARKLRERRQWEFVEHCVRAEARNSEDRMYIIYREHSAFSSIRMFCAGSQTTIYASDYRTISLKKHSSGVTQAQK
ncbi:hypothetical protein C8R44DRAFT_740644 [Mycena epipterygia]|nr:hypothetical protein C8R44DRAFT_740644 [Mycena epipterygia]